MTSETRPACVYAVQGLKRNSTKLLVAMCIGIALAMYGVYTQARASSNPAYQPTIAMATHWLYNNLGRTLAHPLEMMNNCSKHHQKAGMLMRFVVKPAIKYSSLMNGVINIFQILLLKVYCKSLPATVVIAAMSLVGWIVSMVCLVGAIFTCKMMCISCLGIHHMCIIYFAVCRYRIIQNLLCPPGNTNEGACSYPGNLRTSDGPQIFGNNDSMRRRNLR